MLELHFLVMRRLRPAIPGYFQPHTVHRPGWRGGVCIIKMVPVMGLITLIVFTTGFYFNFPREISGIPLPSLGSLVCEGLVPTQTPSLFTSHFNGRMEQMSPHDPLCRIMQQFHSVPAWPSLVLSLISIIFSLWPRTNGLPGVLTVGPGDV